jgi:uncharacterized lipoprotein YmbA
MKIAGLLLVLILSGCASQAIDPSYYLLRSNQDLQTSKLNPSQDFSLGSVDIAAYLDQPGLVIEKSNGQIQPAGQNLWAEPIYDGVRNLLATEIAIAYGQELLPAKLTRNTAVVNIRIDQLHGTLDGTAKIVAYWWLVKDDTVVALNRFSDSRSLSADGYGALVEAEKALLETLANKIAKSLAPASM